MDWTVVISELSGAFGMSQPEIAAACGCGQSTVSGLATGVTKDPRHSTGQKLLALLEAKRLEAATKAVQSPPPARGARAQRRDPARVNEFPDLDRRSPAQVG
jgi:hypothetical protein